MGGTSGGIALTTFVFTKAEVILMVHCQVCTRSVELEEVAELKIPPGEVEALACRSEARRFFTP